MGAPEPPRSGDERRPWPILLACTIGVVECVLLVGYGVAIEVFGLFGQTSGVAGRTEVAPIALLVIFVAFGLLALLVTWGVWQRRSAARTPFFMLQVFAVVAAWPLASDAQGPPRALGVVVIVLAVAAVLAMLSSRGAGELTR